MDRWGLGEAYAFSPRKGSADPFFEKMDVWGLCEAYPFLHKRYKPDL